MNLDFLNDYPPRSVPYGCKSHPMYQQWKKMLDSCQVQTDKLFPLIGGKGITVIHRWFDFMEFVNDTEDGFLNGTDPSVPEALDRKFQRRYLRRINTKSGFNPKNVEWVTRAEGTAIQARTVLVDTVHGKGMTLKQLAAYLEAHQGEDLPPDATIYTAKVKVYDDMSDRFVYDIRKITEIQAIKLPELRRRHRLGLPLLAPVRDYGKANDYDNEREAALCARLDRERPPVQHGQPQWAKERGIPAATSTLPPARPDAVF